MQAREETTFPDASEREVSLHAPPPRRLHRTLRVMGVVGASLVAALMVSHGSDHLAGWWAIFLGLGTLLVLRTVHESQALRLLTLLAGALPFVGAAALVRGSSGATSIALLVVPPLAWLLGEGLDLARKRWAPGHRPFVVALVAVVLCAGAVVAASAAPAATPGSADALLSTARVVGHAVPIEEAGMTTVGGLGLYCDRDPERAGALVCTLDPSTPLALGRPLGERVERLEDGAHDFLRPAGSSDPRTWSRIDHARGVLRPVEGFAPPRSPRAPRALALALLVAVLAAVGLGGRAARLALLRRAIARGVDGRSDGSGIEVGGRRSAVTAPVGPVVVLGARAEDGSYRHAPRLEASRVAVGTRRGRSLRLTAQIARSAAVAALVLALATLPALLALGRGRPLPSPF